MVHLLLGWMLKQTRRTHLRSLVSGSMFSFTHDGMCKAARCEGRPGHDTHRYGLRHSLNDGISRTTDASIVARHGCVLGYGKNCASALSGSSALVLVTGFHSSA